MSSGMPTFVWFGSLATVPPRAVMDRCRQLAVSARAELRSGNQRARVDIVGGEVVQVDGADPKVVAGWMDGSFRVTQALPDFHGDIGNDRETKGSLGKQKVQDLLMWAEEYRLTIKIDLYHEAERAHLELQNGRVNEVVVDGRPDLAALARLEAWREGEWRASLKPLFVEETAPVFIPESELTPTPMPVPMAATDDPPWLAKKEEAPPPDSVEWLAPKPAAPLSVTPEPPPEVAEELPDVPEPSGRLDLPEALAVPKDARPEPKFSDSLPLALAPTVQQPALDATTPSLPPIVQPAKTSSRAAVVAGVVLGVGLLAVVTAAGVWFLRRPAPAPQPVASIQPPPVDLPDAAVAVEATKIKRKPEHDRPVPSKTELRDRAKRLIERARREIIEGHRHSAVVDLEEARKLEPDNLSIRTYMAQAKGKLGDGTLVVETTPKGAKVQIDGAAVGQTPLKIKLPAGEHELEVGDKSQDVEIEKHKKKTIKLNLGGRVARRERG